MPQFLTEEDFADSKVEPVAQILTDADFADSTPEEIKPVRSFKIDPSTMKSSTGLTGSELAKIPEAPPTPIIDNSREGLLKNRLSYKDQLISKLNYIRDNSKQKEAHDIGEGIQVADALKEVNSTNFNKADITAMKPFIDAIETSYKALADKRNILEVGADAFSRGYVGTGAQLAQAGIALKSDLSEADKELLGNLQQVGSDYETRKAPRAVGGLKDVMAGDGVGDKASRFLRFGVESISENLPRMAGAIAGGIAGGIIAGPVGAGVGAGMAGFSQNLGEAVSDQVGEGQDLSLGLALAQATGYSAIDSVLSVEKIAGGVISQALKKPAVSAGRKAFMGTAGAVAKSALKAGAAEAINEPAQSQIVGRMRRFLQTGSGYRDGETFTDAMWETLNEGGGGLFSGLAFGGGAATTQYTRDTAEARTARKNAFLQNIVTGTGKTMGDIDKFDSIAVMQAINAEVEATHLDTFGVGNKISPEARAQMKSDLLNLQREAVAGMSDNAKLVWNAAHDVLATDFSMGQVDKSKKSTFNMKNVVDTLEDVGDGNQMGFDKDSGIGMAKGADGMIAVYNQNGLKMPADANPIFNNLQDAVKFADDLSRYNEQRLQKLDPKFKLITQIAQASSPGSNVRIVDTPAQLPAKVKADYVKNLTETGTPGQAMYDPDSDTVYILHGNIQTLGDAIVNVNHEAIHSELEDMRNSKEALPENIDAVEEQFVSAFENRIQDPSSWEKAKRNISIATQNVLNKAGLKLSFAQNDLAEAFIDRVRNRMKGDGQTVGKLEMPADVAKIKGTADEGVIGQFMSAQKGKLDEKARQALIEEQDAMNDIVEPEQVEDIATPYVDTPPKPLPTPEAVSMKLERRKNLTGQDVEVLSGFNVHGKDLYAYGYRKWKGTDSWRFVGNKPVSPTEGSKTKVQEPVAPVAPIAPVKEPVIPKAQEQVETPVAQEAPQNAPQSLPSPAVTSTLPKATEQAQVTPASNDALISDAVAERNWNGSVRSVDFKGKKMFIPVDSTGKDVEVRGQVILGSSPLNAITMAQENVTQKPVPVVAEAKEGDIRPFVHQAKGKFYPSREAFVDGEWSMLDYTDSPMKSYAEALKASQEKIKQDIADYPSEQQVLTPAPVAEAKAVEKPAKKLFGKKPVESKPVEKKVVSETPIKVDTIAGKLSINDFEREKDAYQVWEITKNDWVNVQRAERRRIGQDEESGTRASPYSDYEGFHKEQVQKAIASGEELDDRVLADYPDLQKKVEAPVAKEPAVAPVAQKTDKQIADEVRQEFAPFIKPDLTAEQKQGLEKQFQKRYFERIAERDAQAVKPKPVSKKKLGMKAVETAPVKEEVKPIEAVKVEQTSAVEKTVSVPSKDKPFVPAKEQKKWLLTEIDKAIEEAPEAGDKASEKITFEVPGDGVFTVFNEKTYLKSFKERISKSFPSTDATQASTPSITVPRGTNASKVLPRPAFEGNDKGAVKILEPFKSEGENRFSLERTFYNPIAGEIVATDGRVLAVIQTSKTAVKEGTDIFNVDGKLQYPNYTQVVMSVDDNLKPGALPNPKDRPSVVVKDTEALSRKLIQANAINAGGTDKKSTPRSFLFVSKDGRVEIEAETQSPNLFGVFDEYKSTKGDETEIGMFNPKQLLDAVSFLRTLGNESITIHYKDEKSPLLLKGAKEYVIVMPLKKVEKQREQMTVKDARAKEEADAKALAEASTPEAIKAREDARQNDLRIGVLKTLKDLSFELSRLAGPSQNRLRNNIVFQWSGQRLPAQKTGINYVRDMIYEAVPFTKKDDTIASKEATFKKWAQEQLDASATDKGDGKTKFRKKDSNIDRERIAELGYTTNLKEGGYITPDGKLVDLSGKKEGGQAGTRSYDHREAGGTAGMQEFMNEGNIRYDYQSGVIDAMKAPTIEQEQVLRTLVSQRGSLTVELSDGIGELDERNGYYRPAKRTVGLEYDNQKADRVINDMKRFYRGEPVTSPTLRFRKTVVTPEQDKAYLDAVQRGDMQTAQMMVDDAANGAGYMQKMWHSTFSKYNVPKITEFGFHLGTKEQAQNRANYRIENKGDKVENLLMSQFYLKKGKFLRVPDSYNDWWDADLFDYLEREHGINVWYYVSADENQEEMFTGMREIIRNSGYDGLVYDNIGEGGGDSYTVFNPEQIKSADAITRDDAGNIIPLSQRFNEESSDIRFRKLQTDTPQFKAWFKDSKVVDADGKPLVVYHGTVGDFNEFRPTRTGEFGPAIYTTDNPKEAFQYAIGSGSRIKGQAPYNIMPLYVSIQNPFTDGVEAYWKRFGRDDGDAMAIVRAQDAGYDGIIVTRPDSALKTLTHYIAFSPTQIKSALANVGTFDPANPDIRYRKKESLSKEIVVSDGVETTVGKLVNRIEKAVVGKKDSLYLSVYGDDRQKVLKEIIFSQDNRAYLVNRGEESLVDVVSKKYGTYAGSDVTQKVLLGMQAMYPKSVKTSFTLGLDEVRLENQIETPSLFRKGSIPATSADNRYIRAYTSTVPEARALQAEVEEAYSDGLVKVTVKETLDDAKRNYDANPEEAKKNLMQGWQESGIDKTDAQRMAIDKIAVTDATDKAVKAMSVASIAEAIVLNHKYLARGTDTARALQIRFDPVDTPEGRRAWLIRSIMKPTKQDSDKINNAATSKDAQKEMEATAQKTIKVFEALKAKGIDIINMSESDLLDNAKVGEAMREISAIKATYGDVIHEWWRNSILSAPTTPLVNAVGNTANASLEALIQRPVEAAMNMFFKNADAATFSSVTAMLKAIAPTHAQAVKNFMQAFRDETSVTGPKGNTLSKLDENNGAIATKFGGRIIRIPQRIMLATDEYFKTIFMAMLTTDFATREFDALLNKGLIKESERASYILEQMKQGSKAYKAAWGETLRWSFQEETGTFINAVMQSRNTKYFGFFFKFIFPFVKTPTNIIKTGIRKTPLGAIPYFIKMYNGTMSSADKMRLGAEQVVSLVFMASLYAMMKGDDEDPLNRPRITGSRRTSYKSSKGQKEDEMKNRPPMSIRVGDKWISYARMEPFATVLSAMVDMLTAFDQAKDGKFDAMGDTIVSGIKGNFTDKTFLQGMSNIVRVMEGDPKARIDIPLNIAAGFNPNIARSLLRSADPYIRDSKMYGDKEDMAEKVGTKLFRSAFPSEKIASIPKYGADGKPIEREGGTAYNYLVPFKMQSADKTTKVDAMISRWNESVDDDKKRFWNSTPEPIKAKVMGEEIVMTANEYEEYQKLAGTKASEILSRQTFNYDNPTARDIAKVKDIYSVSRNAAMAKIRHLMITRWRKEQGK